MSKGLRDVKGSVRRGGPGLGTPGYVLPHTNILRRILDRDYTVVEDDLAKESVIHYDRGKVACKRCGEPRRADALNEKGECRSINVCLKYQHQEVELVASTLPTVDWQKDGRTPPRSNDDVAQIMQEEGISRRAAYRLLQKRHAEAVDTTGVTEGQRVAVMSALINIPEARKDVHTLLAELHEIGVKIDGHDVTKTLFALQKQGFVRFRERNHPRTLYAIVVTDAGFAAWNHRGGAGVVTPMLEEASVALDMESEVYAAKEPVLVTRDPLLMAAIEKINDLGLGPVEDILRPVPEGWTILDYVKRPWPKGDLSEWPWFCDVRNRALRARKLNAAAKILEEVGGHDDAVMTIMLETEFTDLESEVINLLTLFGEIE